MVIHGRVAALVILNGDGIVLGCEENSIDLGSLKFYTHLLIEKWG